MKFRHGSALWWSSAILTQAVTWITFLVLQFPSILFTLPYVCCWYCDCCETKYCNIDPDSILVTYGTFMTSCMWLGICIALHVSHILTELWTIEIVALTWVFSFMILSWANRIYSLKTWFRSESMSELEADEHFDVSLLKAFSVYLQNRGSTIAWIYQILAILPAIPAGIVSYYLANKTYSLKCGFDPTDSDVICFADNECCRRYDQRESILQLLSALGGGIVAAYGIVRFLVVFLVAGDDEAADSAIIQGDVLSVQASMDQKFEELKTLLDRAQLDLEHKLGMRINVIQERRSPKLISVGGSEMISHWENVGEL